jgi:hypothetical protein
MIDLTEARRFLHLLDPTAAAFTFQTFHDVGGRKGRPELARIICSTLEDPLLRHLYEHGSGVWATVNRTDQRGRKAHNVTHIRAVWQEDDDGYAGTLPLRPSLVVESSPGKFHRYWLTDHPATEDARRQHRSVMERMVSDYGSDRCATDICRVLRVPGFLHRKAEPFMVRILNAPGHRYPWEQICEAFPPLPRPEAKLVIAQPLDDRRIVDALQFISADDRSVWLTIGGILKDNGGNRALWDRWSQSSSKYDADEQEHTWNSLGTSNRKAGLGTLFHYAMQSGWRPIDAEIWTMAGKLIRHHRGKALPKFLEWCERRGTRRRDALYVFVTIAKKDVANV